MSATLMLAAVCLLPGPTGDAAPQWDALPARSTHRRIAIAYEISPDSLPIESVELWCTGNRGSTWERCSTDEDRQSPIIHDVTADGLYGFFVIARNATGASSQVPAEGTAPHLWVLVDATKPVLQAHAPQLTDVQGRWAVQVRWSAVDTQFGPRPVSIDYLPADASDWIPVSTVPLLNTGRYDWTVPDGVQGRTALRITVRDEGGNRVENESMVIDIPGARAPEPARERSLADAAEEPEWLRVASRRSAPERIATSSADREARALFDTGVNLRRNGSLRDAMRVLRRAVTLNPDLTDAFVEMADILYREGDFEAARSAYDIALQQHPRLRPALRGAAMVDRAAHRYADAAERLRSILRENPRDAEVWLNLGDVAIYQGDDVQARDCYRRAMNVDPSATGVVEDARRRMDMMLGTSTGRAVP